MRPIAPRTGAPEQTLAEDQPEYSPITVCLYTADDPSQLQAVSRWTFTAEEREAVANGEDIFIAQLLGKDDIMAPMAVQVGASGWVVPA